MTTIVQAQLRIENYRGPGITDDTALALAIQDAHSGSYSCRIGWNGALTLTVPPPQLYRAHLEGDDMVGAYIVKNYSGGVLLDLRGPPNYSGGGLHNFGVPNVAGYTPGSYLVYFSAAGNLQAPDACIIENLYLASGAGADAPFRALHLDGALRTSPEGIRKPVIHNVTAFGATGGNVYLAGICGADIENLCTYAVAGTDGDVYFRGGSGYQSAEIEMRDCQVSTTLHLGDILDAEIEGTFGAISFEASTANHIRVRPRNSPTVFGTVPATCLVAQ